MIATVAKAFSVPDIRRKLLFVAAILALYRLGAYIPQATRNTQILAHASDRLDSSLRSVKHGPLLNWTSHRDRHACIFLRTSG